MSAKDSKKLGRNLEISEITRGLKLLANELDIPIILLSQLSRDMEKRPDKEPKLSDLRDSGSVEQDANIVCFLERDFAVEENKKNAIIYIKKNRNGETGRVEFHFEPKTTKFLEQKHYNQASEIFKKTAIEIFTNI